MKNKYLKLFLKDYIKSNEFKFIVLLSIIYITLTAFNINSIYDRGDGYELYNNNIIIGLLHSYGSYTLNIVLIGFVFIMTTIYTMKRFDLYSYNFIRLKDRKEYHNFCIKSILLNNTVNYIIIFLLIFIIRFIFKERTFNIITNYAFIFGYKDYVVNSLLYMLWQIMKVYIIYVLSSLGLYYLLRILGSKLTIIISIVILLMAKCYVSLFNITGIALIYAFLTYICFTNFLHEFIQFSINVVLYILILKLIYALFYKRMKIID